MGRQVRPDDSAEQSHMRLHVATTRTTHPTGIITRPSLNMCRKYRPVSAFSTRAFIHGFFFSAASFGRSIAPVHPDKQQLALTERDHPRTLPGTGIV